MHKKLKNKLIQPHFFLLFRLGDGASWVVNTYFDPLHTCDGQPLSEQTVKYKKVQETNYADRTLYAV